MKPTVVFASLVLACLLFGGCAGGPPQSSAPAATKADDEEEIVEFFHVTYAISGVNVDDGISKDEAHLVAKFYRDQFLRGCPVVLEEEDSSFFFFSTSEEPRIVVAKNGLFVTREGFQTIRYAGAGLWCWSADDKGPKEANQPLQRTPGKVPLPATESGARRR